MARNEDFVGVEDFPEEVPNASDVISELNSEFNPEVSNEAQEQVDPSENLASARSEYASQLIAFKNKNREKKNKIGKIISDLGSNFGFEKQFSESQESEELVNARNAYILAKKRSNESLFDLSSTFTTKSEESFQFNSRLVEEAEKEYDNLQKVILDSVPSLEKDIATKAFEKWTKLPTPVRFVLSTALLTGTSFALAGAATAGVGGYAGYKIGRALFGAGIAKGTGKVFDLISKKINEKGHEDILNEYGSDISIDSFEKKEKEIMKAFDKEKNKLKKQRLYKAGTMVAVGGAAAVGAGSVWNSFGDSVPLSPVTDPSGIIGETELPNETELPEADSTPASTPIDNQGDFAGNSSKGLNFDGNSPTDESVFAKNLEERVEFDTKSLRDESIVDGGELPEAEPNVLKAKVELSSKGFLQTIHDMKAKIIEQYGGEENVPDTIKYNILNKPTVELAKELHFYDPENNLSGMGYKGESLGIDAKGNLVYEHLNGTRDVMFDAETGEIKQFEGKMFTPKSVPTDAPTIPEADSTPASTPTDNQGDFAGNSSKGLNFDGNSPTDESVFAKNLEERVEFDTKSLGEHIPYKDSFIDVATKDGLRSVEFNGMEIAHDKIFGNGKIYTGTMLTLDDKFQNGDQFRNIREAFTTVFDKTTKIEGWGTKINTIPFEGGKVHIIQGMQDNPDVIKVLLNGKEISVGNMTDGFSKLEVFKELKGGFFSGETAYERAFKVVKGLLKRQ